MVAAEDESANGTNGAAALSVSDLEKAVTDREITGANHVTSPSAFTVTTTQLSELGEERTRHLLAQVLLDTLQSPSAAAVEDAHPDLVETPSDTASVRRGIVELATHLQTLEEGSYEEHSPQAVEASQQADIAANALTTMVLKSSPEMGISDSEITIRQEVFGSNAIADKELDSFLALCYEAVQDFVLIWLIILGVISIVVETTVGLEDGESCGACWLEGAAILCSVCIVVLITASIDYAKQFAFIRLTKSLHETNTKSVIRNGGKQVSVTDDDIVVGDILSVNSHSLASIPADCILLGPTADLKMDESTLTGESKLISKRAGDVILSGTTAVQGSGKMVVISVGINSVAGRIQARVYDSSDHQDDTLGETEEESPLFVKLDLIAKQIGLIGTFCAVVAFAASCIIGLAIEGEDVDNLIDYLIVAITVLAVAVPEGLPLAVTLALAFSSNKMMKEQNLVKHLDACETMGCATTICTDKTGTLTANQMTARALYMAMKNYLCEDPSIHLADFIKTLDGGASSESMDILTTLLSVNTMDETFLTLNGNDIAGTSGNPTEVALLTLVHQSGQDYEEIRNTTRGRSNVGDLAKHLGEGKQFQFSSARKMMSWAVPLPEGGGYRLYTKGAAEVVLGRCVQQMDTTGSSVELDSQQLVTLNGIAESYARRGMRTLGLAYRDLPEGVDFEQLSSTVKNTDGTEAFEAETELVFVGVVGIEDPLRKEVPFAIEQCYEAGIDVRLVTGDSPNTAVSIAYQAGILRDHHFKSVDDEKVATNLKENVLMEGKAFRSKVYKVDANGEKEFDQAVFDNIWPHLRVLARSSPDDKLTLAHGLNQSTLFTEKERCQELQTNNNITIFPDRQVVAMTGDGTNDAPALKRADIGFAMGVAGTQIAKDAADIILLDDNFASIVTAAKWGRNVYCSIQKFLQFQLTVNIAAVVTALTGAFAYQKSPLAAIQLLWVNLLMDSLASLALASEPPVDALLKKPPVNRTQHMITKRMWANMLGQAVYQIVAVMTLLFKGPDIFGFEAGHIVEDELDENSVHYTLIFNAFVWMQLFNEVNCRNLKGEFNVFAGIEKNPIFLSILVATSVLQVLIVEFGSIAFHVAEDGLSGKYWAISLALGAGSLPVQQVINVMYIIGQKVKFARHEKKTKKNANLTTRQA